MAKTSKKTSKSIVSAVSVVSEPVVATTRTSTWVADDIGGNEVIATKEEVITNEIPKAPQVLPQPLKRVKATAPTIESLDNGLQIKHFRKHGSNKLEIVNVDRSKYHVLYNVCPGDKTGSRIASNMVAILYMATDVPHKSVVPEGGRTTAVITEINQDCKAIMEASPNWKLLNAFGFNYDGATRKASYSNQQAKLDVLQSASKEEVQACYDLITDKIEAYYQLNGHNDFTAELGERDYQRTSLLWEINEVMKRI